MKIDLFANRQISMVQVDAFTAKPLGGNPAAVVLMTEECHERSDEWMQSVAEENNLSETAFVRVRDGEVHIRWFTPNKEVELCGHATLAAAHALYERNIIPRSKQIRFSTLFSGVLLARSSAEGMIELDFPVVPVNTITLTPDEHDALTKGFRIGRDEIVFAGKTIYDYIIEITYEAFIAINNIDFGVIARLVSRGVVLTCRGYASIRHEGHSDFSSRCFFPRFFTLIRVHRIIDSLGMGSMRTPSLEVHIANLRITGVKSFNRLLSSGTKPLLEVDS